MSQLVDSAPTGALALRDREARQDHHETFQRSAKLWTLLEALGYAGALVDPTGALASHRFRRAEEEEQCHGRR
jgi:hypothetical protein